MKDSMGGVRYAGGLGNSISTTIIERRLFVGYCAAPVIGHSVYLVTAKNDSETQFVICNEVNDEC